MTIEVDSKVWHNHFKCGGTVKSITKKYAIVDLDEGILVATCVENLQEVQCCGHPVSAIKEGNEGTHWCQMCEEGQR